MPRQCDAKHYASLRVKPKGTPTASRHPPPTSTPLFARLEETKHYLSIGDYRALVRQASTHMACFDITPGIPINASSGAFVSHLYTQQSVCLEASNTLVRSLGHHDIDDVLGRSLDYLCPPHRNWQSVFAEWHQRSLTREPIEIELLAQDGAPWTAQCVVYPTTHNSLLTRFWIVARDISTQDSAIRSLNRIHAHYEAILNTPDTLYFRCMPSGICDYASPATIALLGLFDGSSSSKPIFIKDLLHPDDRSSFDGLFISPRGHTETNSSKPIRFRLRDGTFVFFTTRWHAMTSPAGDLLRYDVIATRLAATSEVRKHRRTESARLGEHLHIAHDLNNLLTVAQAHLDLAAHSPSQIALLPAAQRAVKTCIALTQQFFLSSVSNSKSLTSSLPLAAGLREVVTSLQAVIPTTMTLNLSDQLPEVFIRGDISDLFQIISNLVFNARDALGKTGAIRICAEQSESSATLRSHSVPHRSICIQVSDNGPGIPQHIQKRLFKERFTTKRSASTHGLGLRSVKEIVERLQGSIEIQASTSAGTTFSIQLPIFEDEKNSSLAPRYYRDNSGSTEMSFLRILVADDEPLIRQMFNAILSNMGHSVQLVPDGRLLMQQLGTASRDFDLVIVDDQMPDSSAHALIHDALALRPELTILVTSGDPTLSTEVTGYAPSVTFLQKPFTRSDIETALCDLRRRKSLTNRPW